MVLSFILEVNDISPCKLHKNIKITDNVMSHYSLGRFSLCFFVKSSAFLLNFFLSFVYSSARSARRGCSGSGSLTKATKDCITENI